MTINIADNSPRISYSVADGVTQSSFAVPFEFFDDEDLNVYVDGVEKTLTTDFTVSGGDGSTGTVTISVTGASGGSTVVITRDIPLERTTDFPVSGAFNIVALNTELDRLVAVAADLDDLASRAITPLDYDPTVSYTLPTVDDRKGKTLAFNEVTGSVQAGPSIADTQSVANASADIALLADIQDGTVATNAITTAANVSSEIATLGAISSDITTVSGISSNVTTVATNDANVTTVAGISSNVTTVADNIADINTVADDLNEAVSEINTVATDITNVNTVGTNITNVNTTAGSINNVNTVASDITNINTVSTNISNVNTVAGISANVTTVAGQTTNLQNVTDNLTAIQNASSNATSASDSATAAAASAAAAALSADTFDDTYLGSKASDPSLDNDGDALNAGDLYFNTTSNTLKVYSGSAWQDAAVDSSSFVQTAGGTMTGNLSFGDNDKAIFGAGSDLQIYAASGVSFIKESGSGNLNVNAGNFVLNNAADTQNMFKAKDGAEVELYYNGSQKLETTSTGIDVTGTVTADGLTVDGVVTVQGTNAGVTDPLNAVNRIRFIDTDTTQVNDQPTGTLEWYTSDAGSVGVHAYISTDMFNNGSGDMLIATGSGGSPTQSMRIGSGGDISFYEDTGTTAKFFWDASAESLGIGTTSPTSYAVYGYGPSIELSGGYGGSVIVSDTSQTNKTVLTHFGSSGEGILKTTTSKSLHFSTNDSAPMMTIDSSGNVGIGTSSPTNFTNGTVVEAAGGTNTGAFLASSNNGTVVAEVQGNNADGLTYFGSRTNHPVVFRQNGSERMRIDSSGNLLVGKTAENTSTAGFQARSDGLIAAGRSGSVSGYFNRLTSDGDIVQFAKDGSTVGSIGTIGGDTITIGSGDTGLLMNQTNDEIIPWNTSTNAARDNAIDLGDASHRFKDLYLSGGVYLGGTGSANKLDDYETGEFDVTATPSSSGTVTLNGSVNRASYTKVGRLVHCSGFFTVSGVSSPVGTELRMTLPFAAGNGGDQALRVGMPIVYYDGSSDTVKPAIVIETESFLKIIIDCSTIAFGDAFYFGFTYQSA